MVYICTMDFFFTINKNDVLSFARAWMQLEIITFNELTQSQKDKYDVCFSLWPLEFIQIHTTMYDMKAEVSINSGRKQDYGRGDDKDKRRELR